MQAKVLDNKINLFSFVDDMNRYEFNLFYIRIWKLFNLFVLRTFQFFFF